MRCSVRGKRWCEWSTEGLWFGAWRAWMRHVLLQKPDWWMSGYLWIFKVLKVKRDDSYIGGMITEDSWTSRVGRTCILVLRRDVG